MCRAKKEEVERRQKKFPKKTDLGLTWRLEMSFSPRRADSILIHRWLSRVAKIVAKLKMKKRQTAASIADGNDCVNWVRGWKVLN